MNTTTRLQSDVFTQADWNEVHTAVQTELDKLVASVRKCCPSVNVHTASKTSSRVLSLYSYREFNLTDGDEAEDTVVGVQFKPTPTGEMEVSGDIGGAETGRTDYATETKVIPPDPKAACAAAQELAEELSKQTEVVVHALLEKRPPPNDR